MDTGRASIGITFVVIGVLVLLDQADVLDAGRVISDWWPLLLMVGGGLQLLARPPRRVAAATWLAVGLVLLSITTGVLGADAWGILWPAGVIAVGLWLILRPSALDRIPDDAGSDGRLDVTAVLTGRRVAISSRRFVGGRATAVFGSVELDLTGAAIEGEVALDLVAVLGGIDVRVPSGWRVVLDGPVVLGASESNVPPPLDPDAPTLRVLGSVILGGIGVKAAVAAPPATVRGPA